jgi:hypothetical protein
MLRLVTLIAGVLVGAAALAGDSHRWIEIRRGAWEPHTLPFANIENSLRPLVVAAARDRGGVPEWSAYTFQYQGRHNPLGRKYVYINAFCDAHQRDSVTEWVEVKDGGACFFNAKYDPESKRVYDVVVNGIA